MLFLNFVVKTYREVGCLLNEAYVEQQIVNSCREILTSTKIVRLEVTSGKSPAHCLVKYYQAEIK